MISDEVLLKAEPQKLYQTAWVLRVRCSCRQCTKAELLHNNLDNNSKINMLLTITHMTRYKRR